MNDNPHFNFSVTFYGHTTHRWFRRGTRQFRDIDYARAWVMRAFAPDCTVYIYDEQDAEVYERVVVRKMEYAA